MDYVVTNFGWKINLKMLYILRDFYTPPKSWTSWVLLALSCVGYGILYIDFSAKYCTCVEQSCHIPETSSGTDDTSPCTGLSVNSGLFFPLPPTSRSPPWLSHLEPVHILSGSMFLGSSFHGGLSLGSPESKAEAVDLCVTRDYNPRRQEWKIREVRTRRKSQDKGVAQNWLRWNINDCLMSRAVPWTAEWTASQDSPLEDRKGGKGHCWCPTRCSLLGLFIHPLAAVLAHCCSLLCSGQWPESHCSMELCLLSPQPLADWQEVQRTFSLPQFMFQSAPHVQTEASHLLRSNLWLAPPPILIWFPHSPSPESFPFINHLNIDFCLQFWFLSSNGAHFSAGFYFPWSWVSITGQSGKKGS